MRLSLLAAAPLIITLVASAANAGTVALQEQQSGADKSVVQEVYQLTKSATTARDFAAIIDRCAAVRSSGSLTAKDKKYLDSLASWAHNRRCELRMETADLFRAAGNVDQAALAADQALSDALAAIELDPQRWRARLNRGILLGESGLLGDALEDFEFVCENASDQSTGWYNAGEVHLAHHRFADALDCLNRALEISAGDLQTLTARGHAQFGMRQYEQALQDYEVVARLSSNSANAYINRGDTHLALGNWRDAYDDYTAAARLDPGGLPLSRAAWMYATCPAAEYYRPESALAMANESIKLSGENTDNLAALAAAHAALGEFTSAVERQEQAIAAAPAVRHEQLREHLEEYRENRAISLSAEQDASHLSAADNDVD